MIFQYQIKNYNMRDFIKSMEKYKFNVTNDKLQEHPSLYIRNNFQKYTYDNHMKMRFVKY